MSGLQCGISQQTLDALLAHRREQRETMLANKAAWYLHDAKQEDRPIFCKEEQDFGCAVSTLGLPWTRITVASMLKRLAVGAGVRPLKGPHGTRHSCASIKIANGESLPSVAKHLGDLVQRLVNFYADVLEADEDKAAERFGALLHRGVC